MIMKTIQSSLNSDKKEMDGGGGGYEILGF